MHAASEKSSGRTLSPIERAFEAVTGVPLLPTPHVDLADVVEPDLDDYAADDEADLAADRYFDR